MMLTSMRWNRPFFLHFRVPASTLSARIPDGLTLETEGQDAIVSLVALEAVGPALRPLLASRLAPALRYVQTNVRTYVSGPRGPGLFILDTRVSRWWPTVARFVNMPYHHDGALAYDADETGVAVRGRT